MSRIRLDGPVRGRGSVVAWCDACPPWRELRGSRPAALRAAATHLDQVHGRTQDAAHLRERADRLDDTPT